MQSSPLRIIFTGGGTGGHIYPALSVAHCIREQKPDASILFVGAKGKMEMNIVPRAGFSIIGLWIAGLNFQRKLELPLLPLRITVSFFHCIIILLRFRPHVVAGTGGYAGFMMVMVAALFRKPTVIIESNAYPGRANRFLARFVQTICTYKDMSRYFPIHKCKITGFPVRTYKVLENKETMRTSLALSPDLKTVLVVGGSLGAKAINELIAAHIEQFKKHNIQLIWQCGKLYADTYLPLHGPGQHIYVYQYINSTMDYMSAADVIITRAGASTLAEIAVVGTPPIIIPSPWVAQDHQTHNARALSDQGGGITLLEKDRDQFWQTLKDYLYDEERLAKTRERLAQLAKPNATHDIANEVFKLVAHVV